MTKPPKSNPELEILIDDEPSDEIIGIAFRRSIYVLLAAAAIAVVIWMAWPPPPPPQPPIKKDTRQIQNLAAAEEALPAIPFANMAQKAGIQFVHYNGARGERLLPESLGAGVAIFDFDNDSDNDLFFVNATHWPHDAADPGGQPTQKLYRNDGQWHFTDVTADAGLDIQMYGMGCAIGDIDNDGWVDLLITGIGGNRLLKNQSGHFVDITESAGVGGDPTAWSAAAGFFDYDHDGDLDLLVSHYVVWSREIDIELNFTLNGRDRAYGPPTNYQGTQLSLYRNEGNGRFTECAQAAGLYVVNPDRQIPVAKTLGLLLDDLDGDGWDDIVVANDTVRNFVFVNRHDGTFEEIGVVSGIAYDRSGNSTGAMGIDLAYPWCDQCAVIGIGNFANQMSSFYMSQSTPLNFVDEALSMGIGSPSRQRLTFGVLFADFDLDTRVDFLQINGHLEDTISEIQPSQSYRQPAQLFWNRGMEMHPCFVCLPDDKVGDLAQPIAGRAAAYGDLDGDGDLDLVLTEVAGAAIVLSNDQQLGHHYLRVALQGEESNRLGYGARIELVSEGRTATRFVNPTRSYLSQMEPVATFGLGDKTQADMLRVKWPSGRISELKSVAADQTILVKEPAE